jgi:light-independent protochlorophyllide reductase subunit N
MSLGARNLDPPIGINRMVPCDMIDSQVKEGYPIKLVAESGQREVFCGLTGIVWLHRKIKDAFFLVVGSRTCAHLIQSAAGVMIFAEPRFGTAIIDERDLAGLADVNDELERVVSELLEVRSGIKTLFLVGSCPSEVIKLDLGRAAEKLSEKYRKSGIKVLNYSGSGIETTFTEGEDQCLVAMCHEILVPSTSSKNVCNLLVVGTLADIVEDQMARIFEKLGIQNVEFFPPKSSEKQIRISEKTRFVLAQPFLTETSKNLESLGLELINSLFPFGADGTRKWYEDISRVFGISDERFHYAVTPAYERAVSTVKKYKEIFCGKNFFFFPDSQLEIPLARFLSTELGVSLSEVGTPYLNKRLLAKEIESLPKGTLIVEGQNVDKQIERCFDASPDMTVCGLGLANPLEAKGMTTKWSIELVFTPIHGFDQVGDLLNIFAKPILRNQQLNFKVDTEQEVVS